MSTENKPKQTEFPGLKDDFVAGVDEQTAEARPGASREAPHAGPVGQRFWEESPPAQISVSKKLLVAQTRRDFLIYGACAAASAAGLYWLLPEDTQSRFTTWPEAPVGAGKERFLNGALSLDDAVARALYSPTRLVPTYSLSQAARTLRNNYDGATPDPSYIPDWTLTLHGLAAGRTVTLASGAIERLIDNYGYHEQVTRLCCVEGWSMIAGWGGLRFADLLRAFPPAPGSRWAWLHSSVNLDSNGNSNPYYVSIDLPTALHPQTLLATHQNSPALKMIPLTVDNGAPLRLIAPMKLGLKNIKAITSIEYTVAEPADYWNERGYSKYDGV